MDSTSQSIIRAKGSRGISTKAYAVKTMTWELKLVKGEIVHDVNASKVPLIQEMWKAHEATK